MRAAELTFVPISSLRSCHHRREHAIDRFAAKPVREEIGTSPMLSITVISSSEEACQYLCVCVCVREREREREPRLFVHLCVCLRANVDSDRESEGLAGMTGETRRA
jgi:hypothetical protein